jgi:hypothetical protein
MRYRLAGFDTRSGTVFWLLSDGAKARVPPYCTVKREPDSMGVDSARSALRAVTPTNQCQRALMPSDAEDCVIGQHLTVDINGFFLCLSIPANH